jgi:hypothetical protein
MPLKLLQTHGRHNTKVYTISSLKHKQINDQDCEADDDILAKLEREYRIFTLELSPSLASLPISMRCITRIEADVPAASVVLAYCKNLETRLKGKMIQDDVILDEQKRYPSSARLYRQLKESYTARRGGSY